MTVALSIRNLAVTTRRGRTILSVDALDVAPGALLGLRGPSGAGKSTLIHALGGLLARAQGVVRWGETDLLALSGDRRAAFRAAHIGMIFQDFLLFDELSAKENAAISALFAPRRVAARVTQSGAERLSALGIDSDGRTVASFSGGERQRVAVARALATEPAILLADEPTASLDRQAADRLIADLVAMVRASGTTLVAVSHDERLLAALDRVLTVRDGRIDAGGAGR